MPEITKTAFRNAQNTVLAIAVVTAALVFMFSYGINNAASSPGDNVSGYAWSSNIGWISMNCTNTTSCGTNSYGVTVDNLGNISGHAWSDNIGWVSFEAADVAVCPAGGSAPQLDRSSGDVSGWARALSGGTAESGGWDGCISLSGISTDSSPYGVIAVGNENSCDWDGSGSSYAWGSDVVGWVDFSGVAGTADACPAPGGTLVVNPSPCTIPADGVSCLSNVAWSADNFLGTPTLDLDGTDIAIAGTSGTESVSVNPDDSAFRLRDVGSGGYYVISAAVNASCVSGTVWTSASCATLPVINFSATSNLIRSGEMAQLTIVVDSEYDLTCTFSGGASGSFAHTGTVNQVQVYSEQSKPLTSSSAIIVRCTDTVFPVITTSEEIRIEVIPTIEEV